MSTMDDFMHDAPSSRQTLDFGSKQSVHRTMGSLSIPTNNVAKDPFSLQYIYSSMYASVLEDTLTAMQILGECNNELRITKTMADMVHLRANKYNVEHPLVEDELEGINPKALGKEEYKLIKLANDRKYAYETLLVSYLNLSLKRTYRTLAQRVFEAIDQETHHMNLMEDEAKNRITRRELARQVRQQRNHIKSVNYATGLTIEDLKTQVEDTALKTEIHKRYITNWQGARSEQHHQAIMNKESSPLANIGYYKTRADNEQRVHSEMELMLNISTNEKLEKVESWMNKFDKDIEKMDLKIQIMKNNHTVTLEERMRLEETFSEHERLMKNWQNFKDEREKARQYVEKMNNAATAVQAWWRGLLVRMQLGPYKPVKKPQPKGDKKKKK